GHDDTLGAAAVEPGKREQDASGHRLPAAQHASQLLDVPPEIEALEDQRAPGGAEPAAERGVAEDARQCGGEPGDVAGLHERARPGVYAATSRPWWQRTIFSASAGFRASEASRSRLYAVQVTTRSAPAMRAGSWRRWARAWMS